MLSLSATSYDPNGALLIDAFIDNPYQGERRGSVTATLDGSVSVYDTGYSIADQTVTARVNNPTKQTLETLTYLVAYYGQVILCFERGVFKSLVSFSVNSNVLTINMRLISRLDG